MEMIKISGAKWTIRKLNGGDQLLGFFDNGYGVSVVQSPDSYGSESGLFELAVLTGDEHGFSLCYDTPVTSDVIGWLTLKEAAIIAKQVQQLPKRSQENPQLRLTN
jgi:hypothetical protein